MSIETGTIEGLDVSLASKVCPQSGQACDLGDTCSISRRILKERGITGGVGVGCMRAARLAMLLQDAFGEREDYRPVVGNMRPQDHAA